MAGWVSKLICYFFLNGDQLKMKQKKLLINNKYPFISVRNFVGFGMIYRQKIYLKCSEKYGMRYNQTLTLFYGR